MSLLLQIPFSDRGLSPEVTRLQHPSFGQVAFVAVGATLVGSVELLKEACHLLVFPFQLVLS